MIIRNSIRMVLALGFMAMAQFSCQKEYSLEKHASIEPSLPTSDTIAISFLQCDIDGVTKKFTGSLKALSTHPGGLQYSVNITAKLNNDSTDQEGVNISLNDPAPITAGTYGDAQTGNAVSSIVYHSANANVYGSGLFNNPELPFQCNVTFINDTLIKGNFEGDVYLNGRGPEKITITSGTFEVKF